MRHSTTPRHFAVFRFSYEKEAKIFGLSPEEKNKLKLDP
jgi:hypothetical protein